MSGLEAFQANEKVNQANDKHEAAMPNLLDLQKDMVQLNKSQLISKVDNPIALTNYLTSRDQEVNSETYLQAGTTFVSRMGRKALGMPDASSKFEEARKSGNQGIMISLYEADQQQRESENTVGTYTGAALKTGFLFAGGRVGYGGLATVMAADQARPNDPFPRQAIDTVLGAAKGLAAQALFTKINQQEWNPVLKGWTFGVGERFIDNGLNSRYYLNSEGKLDGSSFKDGALTVLHHSVGHQALLTDAAAIGVSSLLIPINNYTGGAYFKNAFASKLTMAGVAGLTEGSLKELNHQQDKLKPIDWLKVAQKGGETAVLDTLSAVPGTHLWYLRLR